VRDNNKKKKRKTRQPKKRWAYGRKGEGKKK
jgi:hypothetical protein